MSNDESKTSKRRSLRMTLSSTDETPDGHRRSSLASDQPRIRELVIKPLTTQMEGPGIVLNAHMYFIATFPAMLLRL